MMLLQEIANRLQLHSHRLPGGIELDQRPAVAPPGDHDEHRGHRAHPAAREDERPREHDAEVAKQERVERQEPDGERGESAAGRLHRTGRRRAGSTMNGALGTAPSAPSVADSSVTCAPRNLTTYSSSRTADRFKALARAWRFSSATVVPSSTGISTWSQ